MNGNSSDLRTGLPLQMVEIYEPVRSLFVIETTVELLEKVITGKLARPIPKLWLATAKLQSGREQHRAKNPPLHRGLNRRF